MLCGAKRGPREIASKGPRLGRGHLFRRDGVYDASGAAPRMLAHIKRVLLAVAHEPVR